MFRFFGRTMRWAAVGTLLVVGLVTVVGVSRVKNAYLSVQEHLRSNVDELVDSRVALRQELRELKTEYPKRIADLKCQMREIDRDLTACEGDRRISQEVVTLADSDVELLRDRLASADAGGESSTFVSVEFRSELLDRRQVVARAARIAETASSYRARLGDLDQEAGLLREEQTRIRAELSELEREYRTFQAEVGSMLREIESVKRKEKLVAMAERKREDHDDFFQTRANGLSRVKELIERRRIQLDERLKAARAFPAQNEYEARARLSLSGTE